MLLLLQELLKFLKKADRDERLGKAISWVTHQSGLFQRMNASLTADLVCEAEKAELFEYQAGEQRGKYLETLASLESLQNEKIRWQLEIKESQVLLAAAKREAEELENPIVERCERTRIANCL